ncbi:RagB/SusD family nutrient uptake outer membrane protein [Cognatitamlana onchidii]|uniref:RagB/SusD family nutrient uptake outer membrane protein n=1 Tax=Cognatitamlana onchidii TaxID=2562860 RepID=UPI0010A6779A|nr:RagB/SusD family nutrient uptake outer membrane protein [Algibacter onchidii]
MKKFRIICILAALGLFSVYSCEDELNTEVLNAFSEDLVYSDANQVERLVYPVYGSTETWAINKSIWWGRRYNIENGSYEAKFNFSDLDRLNLRGNGWTPLNVGDFDGKWEDFYLYIREIDQFFSLIDDSEANEKDPDAVAVLKAEMRFLRANLYFKLTRLYGGVPVLEKALGLEDDFNIPRTPYEDAVDFIVSELDLAVADLPETRPASEFGRATKIAALAVKSRVLLYAASDLHDPGLMPQTQNTELYSYSKASKWQDAADAAKEVIDFYGSKDLISVNNATDYQNLFLSVNEDIIFARPFGTLYDFGTDVNSLPGQTQTPPGYGGWGLSSPTHNFALEFDMADGSATIGDSSTYDPDNPSDNREMRFYANLLYQGAEFRGRPVDYAVSRNHPTIPHGLDSRRGTLAGSEGNPLHWSKTGYNIRKFQDEATPLVTDAVPGRPYILYRLAEMYLNYAEAQAELGNDAEARTYLNKITARALKPAVTASGEELKEAIKHERRLELCFEGHNFFDERRWMNPERLGFDVRGLLWTKERDGSLTSREWTVVTRPWYDKQYYLPIPQSEIEKAPALLQNAFYE